MAPGPSPERVDDYMASLPDGPAGREVSVGKSS
jgi:hypothetical protein